MLVVKEVKTLVPVIPVSPNMHFLPFPQGLGQRGKVDRYKPHHEEQFGEEKYSSRRLEEFQHTSSLPHSKKRRKKERKRKRQFGVFITPKMVPLRPEKKTKTPSLGRRYWETEGSSTLELPLISSPQQRLS